MTRLLFTLTFCMALQGINAQEFAAGKYHTNNQGVLLDGYDPVSYFTEKGPVKGLADLSLKHDGVMLHFSSQQNPETFQKDPEKYLPAYGGFCAFGMGMDPEKVGGYPQGRYKTSPLSYKLIEKRLYLFYPENEWEALKFWNQNEAVLKQRADKKWAEIRDN